MATPHVRKSIGRSPLWRAILVIPFVLACFALAQLPAAGTQNGILDWGNTPVGLAIITFDAPGAGTGPGQGTIPYAINPASMIAGFDLDASNVYHGFLRASGGSITATFDVPDGGTGPGQGTFPSCNNDADAITGSYIDASTVNHGFLRPRAAPTPRPRPAPRPRP